MGNLRSKTGCLTCRARRVKCDEGQPICGQCAKKSRPCQYEAPRLSIRRYQPGGGESSSARTPGGGGGGENGEVGTIGRSRHAENRTVGANRGADPDDFPTSDGDGDGDGESPSATPYPQRRSQVSGSPTSDYLSSDFRQSHDPGRYAPGVEYELNRYEAKLVHHYVERLGRWLDCSDPSRRFTLRVPALVKHCPVLLHAVLAFAARHRGDTATSEQAYQTCLELVIERLGEHDVTHDDGLLCAIVILRVVEQLSVSITGSDFEQHLAGCAAILRASQGSIVDPSAPTTHDAAFWIHVRQCLYTATVNQQPPHLDSALHIADIVPVDDADHPSTDLRSETAWANMMTWLAANVLHFSFGGGADGEPSSRLRKWEDLGDALKRWRDDRPTTFDPIWSGPATARSIFSEAWFTADWHALAYTYYHFTSLLLINYKPKPRFAVRNVDDKLSEDDLDILNHARAICGACQCSPNNTAVSIVLCHSVFIWGPLMLEQLERDRVLQLLTTFENDHVWPTAWIVNALKAEWNMPE
ncbi:hypothetical protein BDV96DRAFT_639128 [Lophiotrema nucula]|uniref:Zn(2)-C6 fungal-type domain-containing protein n=1 Tax=Lophiotrema nucula TaxID=690887 RepID=A0A6A5ZW00_9PLEO|nr:hypothetical protein BDV96DRAFT_639128 [Lophiotrema nucula]